MIVSVVGKGGVGKTTLSLALASLLGDKVAYYDMDPVGQAESIASGIKVRFVKIPTHSEIGRCLCREHGIAKRELAELAKTYEYIIVDNQAGIEVINRDVYRSSVLIFVTSPNRDSVEVVRSLFELTASFPSKRFLVVSADSYLSMPMAHEMVNKSHGFDAKYILPYDENIKIFRMRGLMPEYDPLSEFWQVVSKIAHDIIALN